MKPTRVDFPDFRREQIALTDAMRNLPKWAGNATLNFYKDSWRRGGYIDRSFTRWPRRKASEGGPGRGLLMRSGALRRSLRLTISGTTIMIGTDMAYAKGHNEGANIVQTVTPRQRRFFWAMHARAKKSNSTNEAEMWKRMALAKKLNITLPKRQYMDVPDGPLSNLMQRRLAAHIENLIMNAMP